MATHDAKVEALALHHRLDRLLALCRGVADEAALKVLEDLISETRQRLDLLNKLAPGWEPASAGRSAST